MTLAGFRAGSRSSAVPSTKTLKDAGDASGMPTISMGWEKDRVRVKAASFLSATLPAEGMSMPKCARAELAAQKIRVKQSSKILVIAAHLLSRTLARSTAGSGNCV